MNMGGTTRISSLKHFVSGTFLIAVHLKEAAGGRFRKLGGKNETD